MINIKPILLLFSIFIFSGVAHADAKSFLRNLDAIKSIKADFEQVNQFEGFNDEVYYGKIFIVSQSKALWDYSQPANTWYLFTKNKLAFHDGQTDTYEEYEGSDIIMLEILTDLTTINRNFTTTVSDDKLILLPKVEIGVQRIEILILNDKISKITTIDNAENIATIIFTNVVYNSKIDESVFAKTRKENK